MDTWKLIVGGVVVGFGAKALFGSGSAAGARPLVALPALKDFGVPFAAPTGHVWPVVGGSREVPYTTPVGVVVGNSGTAFHTSRESGLRFHAGIDLQASPGQHIVAMEDGIVLGNIPGFVSLDAMVIQHTSVIGVYAEVRSIGLVAGQHVTAGQQIAQGVINKDGHSMLHLELWSPGFAPKSYTPWYQKNPPPRGLLDPTRYLLALSKTSG